MTRKTKAPVLLSFSCPVKLQDMEGDDQVRKCERCSCTVQNITDYSRRQLEDLQQRVDAGEKLCVSFRSPVAPAAQSSLSRPVIRISIVVAASITLACYAPDVAPPVFAQPPAKVSTDVPKDVRTVTPKEVLLNQKPIDVVTLSSDEHGFFAGRPAPNAIRDLVNDIAYYHEEMFGYLAYSKRQKFKETSDAGEISVPLLEGLAQSYDFHGPISQARKCYELLVALAEREHPTELKLKGWKERLLETTFSDYQCELKEFERHLKAREADSAIEHLNKANDIRRSNREFEAKHPFDEMATRIDSLQAAFGRGQMRVMSAPFEFACSEAPVITEKWLQSKVTRCTDDFNLCLAQADKDIAAHKYTNAVRQMEKAMAIGLMDPLVFKTANWNLYTERLNQISKHSPAMAAHCAELKASYSGGFPYMNP